MTTPARRIPSRILVVAAIVLGVCSSAPAQVTAQRCLAQQLRASGRMCKAFAHCYARAMKSGKALDPVCFSNGERRIGRLFTDIETTAMGTCLTEGASAAVATDLENGVEPMASALTLTGGHCAGKKMGYLGKECAGYLRCYAVAAASSASLDPACTGVYQARMQKSFTRTENKGKCVITGDRETLEAMVEALAADVFTLLRGSGTTTTTTTTVSSSSTTTHTTTTTVP